MLPFRVINSMTVGKYRNGALLAKKFGSKIVDGFLNSPDAEECAYEKENSLRRYLEVRLCA
jgi:hypothetical protein